MPVFWTPDLLFLCNTPMLENQFLTYFQAEPHRAYQDTAKQYLLAGRTQSPWFSYQSDKGGQGGDYSPWGTENPNNRLPIPTSYGQARTANRSLKTWPGHLLPSGFPTLRDCGIPLPFCLIPAFPHLSCIMRCLAVRQWAHVSTPTVTTISKEPLAREFVIPF